MPNTSLLTARNKALITHFLSLENIVKLFLKSQQISPTNLPGMMKPTYPHAYKNIRR